MEEKLISWLLGELNEEEEMRLEEEYLCDEDKFLQLKEIQNNLIDAYARGGLPSHQRKRFEEQFLSSPWQRRRIVFARALSNYTSLERLETSTSTVSNERTSQMKPAKEEVKHWWQSIFYSLGSSPLLRYSFTVLALLVIVGGSWLLLEVSRLRSTISELQDRQSSPGMEQEFARERSRADQLAQELQKERDERARLERGTGEEQKLEKSPSILSFILNPGMVRGNNRMNRLVLLPGVSTIELKLVFSSDVEYGSSRVQIRTAEGQEVWDKDQLKSIANGSRRQVILRLSPALFANDDYTIRLSGLNADGEYETITNYSFRLEKK